MEFVPWKFAVRSEAAVQTDPFEEEFFIGPSDSELDDGHVASLVRESVQNAIDARGGAEPVRVTFAIHNAEVRHTKAMHYLSGLKPHLAALAPPVPWPIDGKSGSVRWLVYEDFHTTGLCGDPSIVDDPAPGHERREDFYWFWRNVGRSAKTGEKLGRWGLGKTVFPSSSLIHTCELNGGNPFDYLTALQRHAAAVAAAPGEWMPWNYRGRLDCLAAG